jgi:hypothetical protein
MRSEAEAVSLDNHEMNKNFHHNTTSKSSAKVICLHSIIKFYMKLGIYGP